MKTRTTVILSLIAIGLLGYIYFFEQHLVSTGESELRQGRLLPRMIRDKVSRIDIERGGKHLVLERSLGDEGAGTWMLVAPLKDEADEDAVEALLSTMEWAESRRTLHNIGESDRKNFGLSAPRIRIVFTVLGETPSLAIGGDDPRGQGAYAQLDDTQTAYVVGTDLVEAFDTDAATLRNKQVFKGVDTAETTKLVVRSGPDAPAVELARKDGRWWAAAPFVGYGSSLGIADVLSLLGSFRASRYVDDDPKDLAKYGLKKPERQVVASGGNGGATLEVGAPCEGHEGETFVRANEGPVLCASTKELESLFPRAEDLREDRMVAAEEQDIARIRIEAGKAHIEIVRDGGEWTFTDEKDAAADAEAVSEYIRALKFHRALDYSDRADAKAEATITLGLEDKSTETLELLGGDAASVLVRRGKEPGAERFLAPARELFRASRTHFLPRAVVRQKAVEAVRIARTLGASTETARRENGLWSLPRVEPANIEGGTISNAVEVLSNLTAAAFVADAPGGAFGLGAPSRSFVVVYDPLADNRASFEEFAKPGPDPAPGPALDGEPPAAEGTKAETPKDSPKAVTRTIRFGADTGDSEVYGQVDDGPVFRISKAVLTALERPWVSANEDGARTNKP